MTRLMTRSTGPFMPMASAAMLTACILFATACGDTKKETAPVQTDVVERRDIIVTTEGTGTVEPVDTVAVKSQASGLIMQMPVEVGVTVKPGDLIAEIDTRNLRNDLTRAAAAAQAAESTIVVNSGALRRAEQLFKDGVITAVELESAKLGAASARSSLVAAQTNLQVAQQNLEFATVRSEVSGTVISKSASVGTVAASALSNVGGGSTLVTIADLSRVRMRVLVNETDIAQVRVGQPANVSIDAMPNRTFRGVVEKIEPKAVIQQSVTMFPVLVSLANADQSLLPGMNGEVTMVIQDRRDVVSVPIDALRSRTELTAVASGLGISQDSLQKMMQSLAPAGGASGVSGGDTPSASGARGPDNSAGRDPAGSTNTSTNASADSNGSSKSADRPGVARNGGGSQGGARSRQGGGAGGAASRTQGRGQGMTRANGGGAGGSGNRRVQTLFAFVKTGASYSLRSVQIGVTNFDYAEVLGGLNEGDEVALLSVAVAQGERNERSNRVRSMTGSGIPGAPAGGRGR